MTMREWLEKARDRLSVLLTGYWRIVFLSLVVGVVAGLGATIFYILLDFANHLFMGEIGHYFPLGPGGEPSLFRETTDTVQPRRFLLLLLPAVGGLASGWLVSRFAPEAAGHGTDAAIDAYHKKGGRTRAHVPLIKAIASAITIGTGGSGGREGPIAQIGAGFGSTLGAVLRLSARERRILMAAGMAAGVGAIFHAPLAGALFAAEVLYRDLDLEYEVIIPSIVASIVAYAIFALSLGWDPLFVTPPFVFQNPLQLLPYAVLAVVVASGAYMYTKVFYGIHNRFERLRLPAMWKPAIGGLIVGVIGFLLPEALGAGYGTLQKALTLGTEKEALFGSISIWLLLAVVFGKTLSTAFSIGSGGSGGVFGPAIVIGGALGGAVGIAASQLLPGLEIQPGAFVIVGMAGFFAAAANTPISTIIMVSEMTGNYHLLVPSMWVCILAYLLLRRQTLYVKQLKNRFGAPVHLGNMIENVLQHLTVRHVLSRPGIQAPLMIKKGTPLSEVMTVFAQHPQSSYPVVDNDYRLAGVLLGRELRLALGTAEHVERHMRAEDIMTRPITVTMDDTLLTTQERMAARKRELVVVVDKDEPQRIVGTISHADIVAAYHHELLRHREADAADSLAEPVS